MRIVSTTRRSGWVGSTAKVCLVILSIIVLLLGGCRRKSDMFVIALGDNIRTIDPIGSPSVDAASERVRTLIFNSLVKKNEKFDYVGELASDIARSPDGTVFTFTLHERTKSDAVTLSPFDHFASCRK